MVIAVHSMFSLIALILGTINLFQPKGTKRHKLLGYVFFISMILSSGSSFFIYGSKGYSAIHLLSALVIFLLFRAIYAVRFKPKNWLYIHYSSMNAAYISNIIAGTGAIVRTIILPGNSNAGYIVSIIFTVICVYMVGKYEKKLKLIY